MSEDLRSLFESAARSAIIDPSGTTTYRNDNKGTELFQRRFPGVGEIVRVIEASKERELRAAADGGVGTPSVLEFFLKVRASVGVLGRHAKLERETVTTSLTPSLRMALAELDLDRSGEVDEADSPSGVGEGHFVRVGNEFAPCPFQDDDLRAALHQRVGDRAAETIINQKRDYEATYKSARLVYASSLPAPMVAIFVPPWGQEGIVGNTAVTIPAGDGYRRVTFARRLHTSDDITFLDLYYISDIWK